MGTSRPPVSELIRIAQGCAAEADPVAAIDAELRRRGYDVGMEGCAADEPLRRCPGCRGVVGEWVPAGERGCRCGGRERRLLSYLDEADPDRRMTLDALEDPNPSVAECLGTMRKIVAGGRTRGLFLMGLPGRGKTHLMVGLGRALLERGRDVGYYNVARLVARIQGSYGDYGGETRRAIVESVVSHEVVLLDDFGKEHQSANVESILYELLDALNATGRTVVVSTNLPPVRKRKEEGGDYQGPVLAERYDEAVRSRLKAMCERVAIKGEDRRTWEW